jgi:hypothetical protein
VGFSGSSVGCNVGNFCGILWGFCGNYCGVTTKILWSGGQFCGHFHASINSVMNIEISNASTYIRVTTKIFETIYI